MTVIEIVQPPRNSSHEALPFVEAAAKAKLAGSVETRPWANSLAFLTEDHGFVNQVGAGA